MGFWKSPLDSNILTDEDSDEIKVLAVIQNNSLKDGQIANIKVSLLDEDENVIGSQITYTGNDHSFINVTKEGYTTKEFVFDMSELETDVYSAKIELTSTNLDIKFDWGKLAKPETQTYETKQIKIGTAVTKPTKDPVDSDEIYAFKGWYADKDCKTPFEFSTLITEDTTVYAKWEKILSAVVSNITVSGERLTALIDTDVTLTTSGGIFNGVTVNENATNWFENLPAGLTAKVKEIKNTNVDNDTVIVTLSGTPAVKSAAVMVIKVPQNKLKADEIGLIINDSKLVVKENTNSKFAIIGTIPVLDESVQEFNYDGTAKTFAIIETKGNTTQGYTIKYQQNEVDVTPLKAGSYDVVITRAGDNDYSAYSKTIAGGLVIKKVAVSITATAAPDSTVYKNDVTITATVTGVTQPTDKVQFYVNGIKEVSEKTIDSSGVTSITLTSPSAQSYTYKAEYLGDNNFSSKMSDESEFSIDKATFIEDTDYSTSGTTVAFDGKEQSITVEVANDAKNALVEYSTDGVGYSETNPKYRDTGTYTVHYKITMDNWNEVKGSEQVIISKRVAELGWSGYSIRVYDDTASNTGNTGEKTYTVNYKVNGGGTVFRMISDKAKYDSGKTVTIKGTPISSSKFFAGWNTKADGTGKSYKAGDTFKITRNTTLYAEWKNTITSKSTKLKYRVTGKNEVACIGIIDKEAKSITIGNTITYKGITYKITSIAKNAFRGHEQITTVKIGNNVKSIGDKAFYKMLNLKKITIGTGLTTFGKDVFCYSKNGCVITINCTKLKTVKTAINHGTNKMVVKVPKSKLRGLPKTALCLVCVENIRAFV